MGRTATSLTLTLVTTLLCVRTVTAQVVTKDRSSTDVAERTKVDKEQRLRALWTQSIESMLDLDDYGFTYETEQLTNDPNRVQLLTMFRTLSKPTTGGLKRDILYHRSGTVRTLQHGRRLLESIDDRGFAPMARATSNGREAPLLIDPVLLFTLLQDIDEQIVRHDTSSIDGTPTEVLTVALDSEQLTGLLDTGSLGDPRWTGPFGLTRAVCMFGNRVPPPPQNFEGHLALFIDPAFKRVLRLRAHVYLVHPEANVNAGMAPGPNPGVAELEKIPEGQVVWIDGLPERRLKKNEQRATLDLTFDRFGAAELPELDDRTKRLLGLR